MRNKDRLSEEFDNSVYLKSTFNLTCVILEKDSKLKRLMAKSMGDIQDQTYPINTTINETVSTNSTNSTASVNSHNRRKIILKKIPKN